MLLSCYRMYLWRNEFYKLSRGNKKAATMIHLKSFIGRLIAPTGKFWYAHVQRLMQMCSNDQSEYIVVQSGRKHFFGELKLRSDFLCAQKRKFEDREFLFPKNIDWYLSYMYGNYMEIPPEDKREYHVVYQLKI